MFLSVLSMHIEGVPVVPSKKFVSIRSHRVIMRREQNRQKDENVAYTNSENGVHSMIINTLSFAIVREKKIDKRRREEERFDHLTQENV